MHGMGTNGDQQYNNDWMVTYSRLTNNKNNNIYIIIFKQIYVVDDLFLR
jgi:hypothetical protein